MKIIILNGPSSSGKTSIAKCLQEILKENFVLLGLDHIIYTMPTSTNDYKADMQPREGFYWVTGVDPHGKPLMHLTAGTYGKKIYKTLLAQIKCFADQGLNVIVDHVANLNIRENDPEDVTEYELWLNSLKEHDVIFCSIKANQEILDQREVARGERVIGGARAQMIDHGYKYDISIDTSDIIPLDAAKQICKFLES